MIYIEVLRESDGRKLIEAPVSAGNYDSILVRVRNGVTEVHVARATHPTEPIIVPDGHGVCINIRKLP